MHVDMPEYGEEESENATDNENSTDEFFENGELKKKE